MAVSVNRRRRAAPEADALDTDRLYGAVSQGGTLPAAPHALRERWELLLLAVSETVTHYAPDAPEAIQTEAMVRLAGWLDDAQFVSDYTMGPHSHKVVERTGSGFRRSGAMALLTPYRPRRAL